MAGRIRVKGTMQQGPQERWKKDKHYLEWGRKELAKACRAPFDAANKRIRRLQAAGLPSRAIDLYITGGGDFRVKGKSIDDLQKEYNRCMNFLNHTESTVGGARKYKASIESMAGRPLSNDQMRDLFRLYHEIDKTSNLIRDSYGSSNAISMLADIMTLSQDDDNLSNDERWSLLLEMAWDEVNRAYEEQIKALGNVDIEFEIPF